MQVATSRRGTGIYRRGCWSSTRCFSSGRSFIFTTIGAGWGRDGSVRGDGRERELGGPTDQEEVAEMLIARIIFAVAALNLIFLISELTMNVVRVYFG